MKFVHLAPRSAIGRIQRNGIRLGGGLRGKGVYAVPLFRIRRSTEKELNGVDGVDVDFSAPLSSATLWRFLLRRRRNRDQRPVAIVFQLPPDCWPVDMYLKVNAGMAEPLLERLQTCRGKGFDPSDEMMQRLSEAVAGGWPLDLEARVHSAAALGLLLRHYLATGATIGLCDTLEAVIRKPVPPKAVRRLVSLSQTNVEARDRRERERSLPLSEDGT